MTLDIFQNIKRGSLDKNQGFFFLVELNELVLKRTYIKIVSKVIDLCLYMCYIFSIKLNER